MCRISGTREPRANNPTAGSQIANAARTQTFYRLQRSYRFAIRASGLACTLSKERTDGYGVRMEAETIANPISMWILRLERHIFIIIRWLKMKSSTSSTNPARIGQAEMVPGLLWARQHLAGM